ncbi:hypothetical protein JG688_00009717 [Phytophthora aleatoria]|uniref:AraC effector-binding domain-containing protein n=1 Tax=Phytophthora aleatoria TaxID=2496075 RepID=A0A8J5J6D2_9STRA|nr:hypothetical protein JG688_00009717 [Phytophthora aleatoria]
MKAAEHGHVSVVAWLYFHNGQSDAVQAMLIAARSGQLAVVKWLYQNARELSGDDRAYNLHAAVQLAATQGLTRIVVWLLKRPQGIDQNRHNKRRRSDINRGQSKRAKWSEDAFATMSECEAVAAAAVEAAGKPPSIKNLPEVRVLSLRAVIPNYRAQKTLWDQVLVFSRARGLDIAGPCLTIYYDQGYKEKDVDAEVCLPIAKDATVDETAASTSSISVRTLPAVPRAASLVHLGSYDALNPCYLKLYEWVDKEGLRPNAPVREVYLRMNIEDVSEKSFVTEIQQPVG